MKTFLKIIAALVVLAGLFVGAIVYFSAGDREIARKFVFLSSKGDYAGAQALMHDALKTEFPIENFETGFAGTKEYTEVSFSSVSMSGSLTTLAGTAATADGCSSKVSFELLSDQITGFNITPMCKK